MKSCVFSDGRKNISFCIRTGFVKTFVTKQLAAELDLFSLKTRKLLGWVVESRKTSLLKIVELLEGRLEARKMGNFIFIIAITASPFLQKAGTEQSHSILQTLTTVHMNV